MGSINWIGKSALGVLLLPTVGSTALAQEHAGARERLSFDALTEGPRQGKTRYTASAGGQLRKYARSGIVDWGTGGFELRGERFKSGSKSIDSVRLGSGWRRTYAADIGFWENVAPGVTLDLGARIERTTSGVSGRPLLTNPTKFSTYLAYFGVQISGSASIGLVGFDNGGWSERAIGGRSSRIANGEPPARKGAAIEIGSFDFRPANGRWEPQFKLRLGRGRTAGSRDTVAAVAWKVGF